MLNGLYNIHIKNIHTGRYGTYQADGFNYNVEKKNNESEFYF